MQMLLVVCSGASQVSKSPVIAQSVNNRHAGWGEHEQRHCTAARQDDKMESRMAFLEALIAVATEELRRNVEEGSHPHTTES
jgi:hypothetical protein